MITQLLEHINSWCSDNGVEVHLLPVAAVYQSGEPCSGLYDDTEGAKRLIVAARGHDWYEVLAHEFGHACQDQEGFMAQAKDLDPYNVIDSWIAGNAVEQDLLDQATAAVIQYEKDAEQRAVDLLTQHGLVDGATYIQKANRYIFAFAYAHKHRVWPVSSTLDTSKYLPAFGSSFHASYALTADIEDTFRQMVREMTPEQKKTPSLELGEVVLVDVPCAAPSQAESAPPQ